MKLFNSSHRFPATSLQAIACLAGALSLTQCLKAEEARLHATITFSGLYNGVATATDPELTSQNFIPQSYQPLLRAFDKTNPVDGGALDIGIRWEKSLASSLLFNRGVQDHSGDYTLDGGPSKGGVMFSSGPFSMIFERPVEIPSLFWTYYSKPAPGSESGMIEVYASAVDTVPLKTVKLVYTGARGYVWSEEKAFAGLAISKITFTPSTGALNIDDIMVRPVSK